MRVLVVGAGVIGSVYGSQLAAANHAVTVLEHGPRTDEVAVKGLVVRDVTNQADAPAEVSPVSVVTDSTGRYELVLVSVWAVQIASVIDSLRHLSGRPVVLFFGNNPGGHATVAGGLPGLVQLGFPGVGGSMRGGTVEFVRIPQQPTTLESGGGPVIDEFDAALSSRGFATTRTSHMDGWLAYHGVFVGSITAALYRCHGDAAALSGDRDTLVLMCRSIEEGFGALKGQGVPGLPRNLRMLHRPWLRPVAVRYWARTMASPMGERCFAAHARHAEPEMRSLAADAIDRTQRALYVDHLRELLS